jgi:tetratricopeptide (TPR) repeat protein
MQSRYLKWAQALLILGLSLMLFGCDDDPTVGPEEDLDPITLVRLGWSAFESLDYFEATDRFDEAIEKDPTSPDAFSGAGWTAYESGGLDAAREHWEDGLAVDPTSFDIRAGMGFLEHHDENYAAAVTMFTGVLEDNSNYSFVHRTGLDFNDLRVTLALDYYAQNLMAEALLEVQKMNPLFDTNVESAAGVAELSEEIARLNTVYRG